MGAAKKSDSILPISSHPLPDSLPDAYPAQPALFTGAQRKQTRRDGHSKAEYVGQLVYHVKNSVPTRLFELDAILACMRAIAGKHLGRVSEAVAVSQFYDKRPVIQIFFTP